MNNIHYKIKDNPNSSMATKAIAEVSEQSVNDGASNMPDQTDNRDSKLNFWKKFVLSDIHGAIHGGAAATSIYPSFSMLNIVNLPVVAALGVVVGASVESGLKSL
jgi:hypothetical protein